MTPSPALEFRGVSRIYDGGGTPRSALKDVSFSLLPGRSLAIMGRSGSGKTTLLHLAAGIDFPTEGKVLLMGRDLASLPESERSRARRDHVGLVFQFFHLLPHLSVLENVLLPAWIAGEGGSADVRRRARDLLEVVELGDRAGDPVALLSGGEMQRVAIGRAMLRHPKLVLADEPTGNLDDDTGRRVMEMLLAVARDEGCALVYATHSREMAALAGETRRLHSGTLDTAGSSS